MKTIKPFANESDSMPIGGLTVENRTDRVQIYGSADITRDKAGLEVAKQLKALVDATVEALTVEHEAKTLPDHITIVKTDTVENPFAGS